MMIKILKKFDQSGGVWMGVYTSTILILSVAAFLFSKDLPNGVVSAYGLALGAFAGSKTIKHFKGDISNDGK